VDAYLRKIVELGCTPNGVFGVKIMWSYLDLVIAKLRSLAAVRNWAAPHVLPTLWPNLKYIHIIRRDKMRQAVSLAKAVQSGMWVDLDPAMPSATTRQLKRVFAGPATRPESTTSDSVAREPSPTRVAPHALRYDFRQLMALYRTLQGQDNAWQAHFRAADVEPLHVFYEDLIVDHRRVATTVAGFLGIDGAAQVTLAPIPMRRQADVTNEDWFRRFSHELAGFAAR
jgi:LPS sulfotransferase NodH